MVEANTAFVCGWPVEHSRSPIIHNYWLKQHGITGSYIKQAVTPEGLKEFIEGLRGQNFRGGNITIPHKETALELMDILDPVAKRLGAVNTIWLEGNKLHGANTDGYGFLANLDQFASGWDQYDRKQQTTIVLGAGGAARAIVDALISRGFNKIRIINRTQERAEKLACSFGMKTSAHGWPESMDLMSAAGLLINTTSLGMEGKPLLELNLGILPKSCLVTDIVYVPLETPLLAQASKIGLKTVDGLGMLLHQAVPGFEKWFGVRPTVTSELRNLVLSSLKDKS